MCGSLHFGDEHELSDHELFKQHLCETHGQVLHYTDPKFSGMCASWPSPAKGLETHMRNYIKSIFERNNDAKTCQFSKFDCR